MLHHVDGEHCPLCAEKLEDVAHELAEWFQEQVKPAFPATHVSWGYRGKEDQERAFLEGKSKAHWPHSAHNHEVDGRPCSLALDLFQIHGQVASWGREDFQAIEDKCCRPGFVERAAKSIGDLDHFQLSFKGPLPQGRISADSDLRSHPWHGFSHTSRRWLNFSSSFLNCSASAARCSD